MNTKVGAIQKLLTSCREEEAKYIVRTITVRNHSYSPWKAHGWPQGNLRIGVLERTLVVGLARAAVLWELMNTESMHREKDKRMF
jgi:hypothetical protein